MHIARKIYTFINTYSSKLAYTNVRTPKIKGVQMQLLQLQAWHLSCSTAAACCTIIKAKHAFIVSDKITDEKHK